MISDIVYDLGEDLVKEEGSPVPILKERLEELDEEINHSEFEKTYSTNDRRNILALRKMISDAIDNDGRRSKKIIDECTNLAHDLLKM